MKLQAIITFKEIPYSIWSIMRWISVGIAILAILSVIASIVVDIIVSRRKRK